MDKLEDPPLRHLFDTFSTSENYNVYERNIINLSVGAPGPDVLEKCGDMMVKAATHRWMEEKKEGKFYLYQYGITAGLWECREELAKFLSRKYGDSVAREELILSCGASHGLQLLLVSIMAPNGVIFIDEVTYFIALEAFQQFPLMKIVPVPMKDSMVDLTKFEQIIEREKSGTFATSSTKLFWGMFYTMPTFHNPTGMVLDEKQSKELVRIARKHEMVVVCDDVYNLLYYEDGFPPHRLYYYDDPTDPDYKGGNVVSNGSFSKILFPAVRVGWLECKPRISKILRQSGIMKSGGGVNHYVSGLIGSLLEMKLQDEILDSLIEKFQDRLTVICKILDKSLPKSCSYKKPKGGYFIWIKLANGIDGGLFNEWCQKNCKVNAIPGHRFSQTGDAKNFLRISFSFHPADVLREATQKLCDGLAYYIKDQLGEH